MNPKEILPVNKEGNLHGYCEKCYHDSDQLWFKGIYIHNDMHGYIKWYNLDGSVHEALTGYFFGGRRVGEDNKEKGYCYIWDRVEL